MENESRKLGVMPIRRASCRRPLAGDDQMMVESPPVSFLGIMRATECPIPARSCSADDTRRNRLATRRWNANWVPCLI